MFLTMIMGGGKGSHFTLVSVKDHFLRGATF